MTPGRALSRRGFVAGGALALTAALSGCSGGQLSSDPRELVLWYWNRSLNPRFIKRAAESIPGRERYHLRADLLGNQNWDTKVRTTLAGRAYTPDLFMINSNASLYFPGEQLFVDLNRYASDEVRKRYYDWKWALGTTPSKRQCFWPVDTGPTGFYYNTDVLDQADLPTDPGEVQTAIDTWEDLLTVGEQLRSKSDVATFISGATVFNQYVNSSKERFFDKDDQPLFERPDSAVKQAWDFAVEAIEMKLTANLQSSSDQNAGWVSGKVAAHIEGAWWSQVLQDTAPDLSGAWRVTRQPVSAGNSGGSFLAVPKTCKDPRAAYELIAWMTSPENQATTYNDIQLIPSTPGSFEGDAMKQPGDYFGDQNPLDVIGELAKGVPTSYLSTFESQVGAFGAEITNVEAAGKDPDRAWRDAVSQTNRALAKLGVGA